jgi:alkanesulfonate monooxygenase SsuD/methylene tetrahydromethanopterin reductase-like flavin-dependent oxidoreductase (luciferase family)
VRLLSPLLSAQNKSPGSRKAGLAFWYRGVVEFGAHLPLMDFGGLPYTLDHLVRYARTAEQLGFDMLCANDHLVFAVPWLDGPTALATVIEASGQMTLATTVALVTVRGPVPMAKALAAIDRLSGGRLLVGAGPGSSPGDYHSVGIEFEQRWARLDEAVRTLRVLWGKDPEPFTGRFYSTDGIDLRPLPMQAGGPPIWIGSWGSEAGLRRVARLGDGWLASAYNTTPASFAEALSHLDGYLADHGKDPETFPNSLSTMWFYITENRSEADHIFRHRVVPAINRPESLLRERLPIGPAGSFADLLAAFKEAGLRRVLLWPVADEARQLELFCDKVASAV